MGNQEHKRAAKMGRWVDVPGTVARFWAKRSHLRLLRKASSVAATPVCKFAVGGWVIVRSMRDCGQSQERLAYVRGIRQDASGNWVLRIVAFQSSALLCHPDAHGLDPFCTTAADVRTAADDVSAEISVADPAIQINRLLACEHQGQIRFVEQL